jgi:hypothetical protein
MRSLRPGSQRAVARVAVEVPERLAFADDDLGLMPASFAGVGVALAWGGVPTQPEHAPIGGLEPECGRRWVCHGPVVGPIHTDLVASTRNLCRPATLVSIQARAIPAGRPVWETLARVWQRPLSSGVQTLVCRPECPKRDLRARDFSDSAHREGSPPDYELLRCALRRDNGGGRSADPSLVQTARRPLQGSQRAPCGQGQRA